MKKSTILAVALFLSSHSLWAAGDGVRDMFASPYFYGGLGLFIFLAFTFFILRHAFAVMKEATLKAQGRWEEYQEKQVEEEEDLSVTFSSLTFFKFCLFNMHNFQTFAMFWL